MDRIRPYKNRKQAAKRERIIMVVSSVAVMAALTMTGVYMKEKQEKEQDDGYSVDLAELDTNVKDKYEELVEDVQPQVQVADNSAVQETPIVETPIIVDDTPIVEKPLPDEELDYMPWEESLVDVSPIQITEVGSGLVEIPGLTDIVEEAPIQEAPPQIAPQELYFSEEEGLFAPVEGEILMHYNMDNTVYFATLDQYKYNPAVIFQAVEGSNVLSCADGKVKQIYQNEEIGHAVVLELGNGYEVTYGQLAALYVNVGDTVTANQVIATVAAPTKYYVVEGTNLYFSMKKDGTVINPEGMLAR